MSDLELRDLVMKVLGLSLRPRCVACGDARRGPWVDVGTVWLCRRCDARDVLQRPAAREHSVLA